MPDQVQLRGGTAADNDGFTGANREVTVDTTNKTLRVHDGTTSGGSKLAAFDEWGRLQVADPVDDSDVVNKSFMDTAIAGSQTVLAVKQAVKTDTQAASLAPGVSTPVLANGGGSNLVVSHAVADAANKVLIVVALTGGRSSGTMGALLTDDGTAIGVGDASGSRVRVTGANATGDSHVPSTTTVALLYTPGDVASHDYGVDINHLQSSTVTVYVNRTHNDVDASYSARAITTVTIMEVAA